MPLHFVEDAQCPFGLMNLDGTISSCHCLSAGVWDLKCCCKWPKISALSFSDKRKWKIPPVRVELQVCFPLFGWEMGAAVSG